MDGVDGSVDLLGQGEEQREERLHQPRHVQEVHPRQRDQPTVLHRETILIMGDEMAWV